jgi:S-(hydroxymethyl)glutathione dehydrogenase/alcohol dehydrogenase
MRSQAAVLVESHAALVVGEIEMPPTLDFGQVLVEIHFSGVCASQVHEIQARKGPDAYLPHLLGHEGSGVVLAVGPGVSTVHVNDHVVLHWRQGAGAQSPNPKYSWGQTSVNAGSVTTFNSHAVVSENRVTTIPLDFDMRLAPLLGCSVTTAFGAVGNDAGLKVGESVVVFGVGGVGLAAIMAAALTSAHPVIAVDIDDAKLAAARAVGATHVVNNRNAQQSFTALREILGGQGADAVLETTGVSSVISMAYEIAGDEGRTILVGVPDPSDPAFIRTLPLHFGKVLTGSHGGGSRPQRDIPRLIRLCESGKLDLGALPVTEHALSNVNEALELLNSGVPGRQLLRMG